MKTSSNIRILALAAAMTIGLSGCSGQGESTFAAAETAFENREYSAARIHLVNLMQAGESDAKTQLLYARLMLELGDGIGAEAAVNNLPEDALDKHDRRTLLAHSYIMQGKADDAEELFASAIKDEKYDDFSADEFRMLIWALREQGKLSGKPALMKAALDTFPKSTHIQVFHAREALEIYDLDTAAKHAAQALKNGPRNYEALILSGEIEIRKSNLKGARTYYAKAAEYYPDHAIPLANMAGLDLDLGDLKSAEEVLKRGMQKHGRFPFMLFQNARLAYEKRDYDNARYAIQTAKEAYDNYTPLMLLSAKVEAKLGNREAAIRELRKLLSEEPGNEEASKLLSSLT